MNQHGHAGLAGVSSHKRRVTDVEQGRSDVVTDGVDQECFTTSVGPG